MKKLLVVLILSPLALSGCGLFTANHAWKEAKQENPLQVPPGFDKPATTAALTIPAPSKPKPTATQQQPAPLRANATSMHMTEGVAEAYKRVGLALQLGDVGTVTAHNAAEHTYQLSINTAPKLGSSQGFLQKHFSNMQQKHAATSSDSSSQAAGSTATVTLAVTPGKNGGSTVSAHGEQSQAAHVIGVLRSRLGG